jgi:nitroreductase
MINNRLYDSNEIRELLMNRRSIRQFSPIKPKFSLIQEILDVARWAPSHCNTQDALFIIIDDEKIKEKIVEMGGSIIIKAAPIGILVLYCNKSDNLEYLDYIQSGAAIIQSVLLYSHACGLGSCWVAHLPKKTDLKKLFNIHQNYDPIAYIIMGYPKKEPLPVKRKKEILEIISYNEFNFSNVTAHKTGKHTIKTYFRQMYYKLPTPIKKIINPLIDRHFVKKFEN